MTARARDLSGYEAAKALARRYADTYQTQVALFDDGRGCCMNMELRYLDTDVVRVLEVVGPRPDGRPRCPACSRVTVAEGEMCKACRRQARRR